MTTTTEKLAAALEFYAAHEMINAPEFIGLGVTTSAFHQDKGQRAKQALAQYEAEKNSVAGDVREEFEKWYFTDAPCPEEDMLNGMYLNYQARFAWSAWQAAWNIKAAQQGGSK